MRVPRPGSMSVNTKAEIDPTPPDALDFSKATKQSPSFGSFPTDHAHVRDEVNTPCAPESEPFVYATPMEAACKMLFGERGAADLQPAVLARDQLERAHRSVRLHQAVRAHCGTPEGALVAARFRARICVATPARYGAPLSGRRPSEG